jgi:hypothetical protein
LGPSGSSPRDVYPADELAVQPRSTGPYVFDTAQEAKRFIQSSLVAIEALGCDAA